MNYYCLVAGLPDIDLEDSKLAFTIADFKEEVWPQMSVDDARLMKLFFTKFDNLNLLLYLKDKEAIFDRRGNVVKEELEEALELIIEGGNLKNRNIPPYFKVFVEEFQDVEQPDIKEIKWENRLAELYYRWAMKCGNSMISNWFEFNQNLNNILAAYSCRKHHIEVEVVGDNEVAENIKTSRQRDFGLTGIIDDLDIFQGLAEETDLFEREKEIDLVKWQWLDEQTFFKYFSIERVFAYLVKLDIIERWVSLNPEEGEKKFRKLINSMKESVMNQKSKIENQK